jgi:DnaJ family protein C protein 7
MEFNESVQVSVRSKEEILAELKKERGNQLYKIEKYQQAISLYTEAIELCPDTSSYYGNRSACYMMLYQYELALKDARKAVDLDRSFTKGYIRIAKCSLALGKVTAAKTAFSKARELSLANSAILPEVENLNAIITFHMEGKEAYLAQDYKRAIFCVDRILEHVPCTRYNMQKAACFALLGQYQEAQHIANDILHIDEQNADAIYIRGYCLYYQGNVKGAFSQFKNALRLAPDHGDAMKYYMQSKAFIDKMEEGEKTFNQGRFSKAYTTYTEALKIDPKNNPMKVKLFLNRAQACSRLGRLTEAVADCTSALGANKEYPKILLLRARFYTNLKEFENAVKDYKRAFQINESHYTRILLEEAELALKKSKHKDYYMILGVDRNASPDEIKKSYRRKALIHHPDRHMTASEAERKEEENNFKKVGEAFATLFSPEERARYDSKCTEDMEDMSSSFSWNSTHRASSTKQEFRFSSSFNFRFRQKH